MYGAAQISDILDIRPAQLVLSVSPAQERILRRAADAPCQSWAVFILDDDRLVAEQSGAF